MLAEVEKKRSNTDQLGSRANNMKVRLGVGLEGVRSASTSTTRTRSPEGQRFGENLRRIRKERGLSQEALAEAANMTADYLASIERGDNVPTLTVILSWQRR